jgi:hypothetical protein
MFMRLCHLKIDFVALIECALFQNGICFATDKGLKVTVEDSKCVQASAFIQREVFQVC